MRTAGQSTTSRWPDALERFDRATAVMPGGNSRTQLYVPPYPVYAARGYGHTLELTDGARLTDFLMNYTATVHGHGHPEVKAAAKAALDSGGPLGMPTPYETDLAAALQARVPTMERLRFTNSGSEATLHAFRTARAFTGRTKIAKAEGAYHGSHDLTDYSVKSFGDDPREPMPQTQGMPAGLSDSIVIFEHNDLPGALAILDQHKADLATVVLEGFLNAAGVLAADTEYVRGIAGWCRANDVLLTIDEVASFRTAYHGIHAEQGIAPDLICLGKAIGGGFPVGAFGGREDVMAVLDPRVPGHVRHAGTFNGHPAAMAAGLKALELLDEPTIARMNRMGERIADGVRSIGADRGLPVTATVVGSIGNIHLAAEPPRTPRESIALLGERTTALYWALIERGYAIAPRGQYVTCSLTTEEHCDGFLEAIDSAAAEVLG